MAIETIHLDEIYPNPWQTRLGEADPDYIASLAVDIALNGLLQTPIGRRNDETGYIELAFGHNRLAAFIHLANDAPGAELSAQWMEMPVDVRELSDMQMANFAWSENEKRQNLTAIERARAIERRMEDFGWSNRDAGEKMGIDHSTISNVLKLLKLPDDIQAAIQNGQLSERQAMAITILFDLPDFREIPYYQTRKGIIGDALNGASSDKLRKDVSNYLDIQGKSLAKAEFKLGEVFTEGKGVYCGMCSTCDKRLASRNLCFDRDCFDEKTDRVHRLKLEAASLASGYKMLNPDKEGYPSDIPDHLIQEVKATKCPNLVLAYGMPRSDDHGVPGHPYAMLVCEKRNQSCSCVKGLRANLEAKRYGWRQDYDLVQDSDPHPALPLEGGGSEEIKPISSAELEEAARQARKEKLDMYNKRAQVDELVVRRLVDGFAADHPGAFYLAANRFSHPSKPPEIDACYVALAMGLVRNIVPAEASSVADMLNIANSKLESLGMEPVRLEKTMMEVFGGESEGLS